MEGDCLRLSKAVNCSRAQGGGCNYSEGWLVVDEQKVIIAGSAGSASVVATAARGQRVHVNILHVRLRQVPGSGP